MTKVYDFAVLHLEVRHGFKVARAVPLEVVEGECWHLFIQTAFGIHCLAVWKVRSPFIVQCPLRTLSKFWRTAYFLLKLKLLLELFVWGWYLSFPIFMTNNSESHPLSPCISSSVPPSQISGHWQRTFTAFKGPCDENDPTSGISLSL